MIKRHLYLLVIPALLVGSVIAAPVTLTNLDGKGIEVEITSANETSVTAIRTSDRKEFSIDLNKLNAVSIQIVKDWIEGQKRLPTRQESHEFRDTYGRSKWKFNLEFKLPPYDYGCKANSNYIIITYDLGERNGARSGVLEFTPTYPANLTSKESIAEHLGKIAEVKRKSLSPDAREEQSYQLEKHDADFTKFKGYYVLNSKEINDQCFRTYYLTDGKIYLVVKFQHYQPSKPTPITKDNLDAILNTLTITNFESKE
jgi:hypothetical protein